MARLPSGSSVALCAVHLTSGQLHQSRSPAAVDKRRQQLQYVLSKLDQLQHEYDLHVIAGDFNFKGELDDAVAGRLLEGFVEADHTLTSATFDPRQNSLAGLNSNQTAPMRLDRIYMRQLSKNGSIQVQGHRILGQDPIRLPHNIEEVSELCPSGIHASDHFGLISNFVVHNGIEQEERTVSWSTASALAIIPGHDVQECVDTLWRAEYDPSYQKWPPHVNLLYPFVNVEAIPEVCSSIRNALTIQAYELPASLPMEMGGVGTFKHKSSHTVFLSPADGQFGKLHEIVRRSVSQRYGMNSRTSSARRRSDYTPHMTIAKLKGYEDEQVQDFVRKAEIQLPSIAETLNRCEVNSLSVLQRIHGKMIVVDSIQIPNSEESHPVKRSFELVKSITRQIFGEASKPQLIPVGSSLLLDKRVFTDLDIVVLPPEECKEYDASSFFQKMRSLLPDSVHMRLIPDAHCPIISLCVRNPNYLPIDIIFGDGDFTREIVNDSSALQTKMEMYDTARANMVKEALFHLKLWAQSKQFCGRAFNLFPGIAWPVALFCLLADDEELKLENWRSILTRFFDEFHNMDWKRFAIKMDGKVRRDSLRSLNGRDCSGHACVIFAPTSALNVAEFVVSAALKSFCKEAKHALAVLRADSWERMWAEYVEEAMRIENSYEYCIDVVVRMPHGVDREEISGWLKGKFVRIIERHFESKGIAVRPTTELQWQEFTSDGIPLTEGVVSCGIDSDLTTVESSSWHVFISAAEAELRDKFLRSDKRPINSKISILLRHLPSVDIG
ncbi:polynucleotide adenylyltransferase [Gracilaria domingensis]|nr:polynucleotide adenylyltransferase [Gracilaria domingensis]